MTNDLDSFLATTTIPKKQTPKGPTNSPTRFRYHPDGYILPSLTREKELAYVKTLTEDTCASFDEWKECGYWVVKGAKSCFKDCLGIPQFTKEQVKQSNW